MLRLSKIGNKVATKNGGYYRSVFFRQYDEVAGGLVPTNLEKMRNVFSKNDDSRGDVIYDLIEEGNLRVGDNFGGNIEKFETTPYQMGDNEVTVITLVTFKNEDKYALADKQLKTSYASVVIEGVVRSPEQRTKPVTA